MANNDQCLLAKNKQTNKNNDNNYNTKRTINHVSKDSRNRLIHIQITGYYLLFDLLLIYKLG